MVTVLKSGKEPGGTEIVIRVTLMVPIIPKRTQKETALGGKRIRTRRLQELR